MDFHNRCGVPVLLVCSAVLAVSHPVQTQGAKAGASTRLDVAPGSKAGYRVNEQLARFTLPNDAVGTTDAVSGSIGILPDGSFSNDSKLTVDLRTLKSDEPKRDGFLRENTLETARFPRAEFVPRRQKGLTLPIPSSGTARFQLIGDMALHGVTSELTWNVVATLANDTISATATTNFPFAKFGLTIPKIFGLVSVVDDIKLELDIRLRRAAAR